jgi:electron transport complex protein RnfC
MSGGLYFGAPGWSPDGIDGFEAASESTEPAREAPKTRAELIDLLRTIHLGRTSAITPGMLEQVEDIGERRVRAVVLNLLPTQPEDALASALTRSGLEEMIRGLAAVRDVLHAKKVLIVVDRHDWRLRRLWRKAIRGQKPARYKIVKLLNKYPQGHPTLLMRSLFRKTVAVGKLPTQANRVIVDPVACWGLGRFLRTGEAFTQRPVQLFAPGCGENPSPRVVMGLIGETVTDFCARFGVQFTPPSPQPPAADFQVIVNGMMAGSEVNPAIARIRADTESVAVRPRPALEQVTPCFSCGWCVDVCPTGLNPVNLLDLAERASDPKAGELRSMEARESLNCIGCGLCSYVCPTRLPLTEETLRLRGLVVGEMQSKA